MMIIREAGTEISQELLTSVISEHKELIPRYERMEALYEGDHEILHLEAKADYKPDNRLVCNFAKYIVDTLNGFFIGIPIKISHEDQTITDFIEFLDRYNTQDDNNAELSKNCSIYGHAYELYYMDEEANIGITQLKPTEAFIVYDDSILHRPMFSVRTYLNVDGIQEGTIADAQNVYHFQVDQTLNLNDFSTHPFGAPPMVEYMENAERQGAFENVETLINAYNRAISEKANDVDYYADAYLKILGASLDEDSLQALRDNRIINLTSDFDKVDVGFLDKPQADGTQENLINRLEKLIFHLSMVANINDENFGDTSGVALKYRLQSMSNLAITKERKFKASMTKRYKILSNVPTSKIGKDGWIGIEMKFTRNMPNNIKEESEVAKNLAGITSQETQLSVLSFIEDVQAEIDRINEEKTETASQLETSYVDTTGQVVDETITEVV